MVEVWELEMREVRFNTSHVANSLLLYSVYLNMTKCITMSTSNTDFSD